MQVKSQAPISYLYFSLLGCNGTVRDQRRRRDLFQEVVQFLLIVRRAGSSRLDQDIKRALWNIK